MKVVVVYESPWGSAATFARAMAEGLGTVARAMAHLAAR
jgi:flavorubredoxin